MKSTKTRLILNLLLLTGLFTACKKDKAVVPELAKPTIDNIEVGLNNNEIGVIGRDFHFNASILAGDKLVDVQIKILPISGEIYTKPWKHEIVWQYKGLKNATVHKHFNIPEEAAEGKYDFIIVVNDENGTKLEVRKTITIYDAVNLPVDPTVSVFNVLKTEGFFYRKGVFTVAGAKFKKGETLYSQVSINNVKGDGEMYILLIPKKHNHRPESIGAIDFSKVIVYDRYEHKGWAATDTFTNSIYDTKTSTSIRDFPELNIGADLDNNTPQANPINGVKAWESGNYYFGYIYLNTSYNTTLFNYIEFGIDYN